MGGGNALDRRDKAAATGLSPRGRGKHIAFWRSAVSARSIPAWAGETRAHKSGHYTTAVYPRVGGGNSEAHCNGRVRAGLSPRGRGKQATHVEDCEDVRSIPAWAGETSHRRHICGEVEVYPRVGGGNQPLAMQDASEAGLSPRGRGKLPVFVFAHQQPRSIPAWAGETTP